MLPLVHWNRKRSWKHLDKLNAVIGKQGGVGGWNSIKKNKRSGSGPTLINREMINYFSRFNIFICWKWLYHCITKQFIWFSLTTSQITHLENEIFWVNIVQQTIFIVNTLLNEIQIPAFRKRNLMFIQHNLSILAHCFASKTLHALSM